MLRDRWTAWGMRHSSLANQHLVNAPRFQDTDPGTANTGKNSRAAPAILNEFSSHDYDPRVPTVPYPVRPKVTAEAASTPCAGLRRASVLQGGVCVTHSVRHNELEKNPVPHSNHCIRCERLLRFPRVRLQECTRNRGRTAKLPERLQTPFTQKAAGRREKMHPRTRKVNAWQGTNPPRRSGRSGRSISTQKHLVRFLEALVDPQRTLTW